MFRQIKIKNLIIVLIVIVLVFLIGWISFLDSKVRNKLDGALWTVPAKIYSRPLEIGEGGSLNLKNFIKELNILSYKKKSPPRKPGEYSFKNNSLKVFLRGFEEQPQGLFDIKFGLDSKVSGIKRADGISLDLLKLEPLSIGGMFPSHMEDRLILSWSEVPEKLVKVILAVEDKDFFEHHGVSPKSILRAIYQNFISMEIREGGSTITQQLSKSLFFSPERTLIRKINEALSSLLIEFHYSKEQILLAYINDVFLSQSGKRAIHGFGLASDHFFGTQLKRLKVDQLALLVGMLKGPSMYNPRRNPDRAKERRDLVIDILAKDLIISSSSAEDLKNRPIALIKPRFRGETRYPSFHDLVRIELKNNFKERDLRTKGLKIYTNLDPVLQRVLEDSLKITKKDLVKNYGDRLKEIEGAAVIIDFSSGEVKALAGGIDPSSFGFNRALNAIRPVGSLIKPFVYLTALSQYKRYTLTSVLDDSKLKVNLGGGRVWEPNNFDKKYHGDVLLHRALWDSYNIASARLGMELGYQAIDKTFRDLGINKKPNEYPSLFVGAYELSPIEVIQAYQTISSNGFFTPLRAVREIKGMGGDNSFSYPNKMEQRFRPEPVHLLKFALSQTFVRGTARGYPKKTIGKWGVGGKTGTSDNQRDSWFVGYAGRYLALIWLGFDDNREMPLTGRSGALQVWKKLMNNLDPNSLTNPIIPRINYEWVDLKDGLLSGEKCNNAIKVPYIRGTEPKTTPNSRRKCRKSEDSHTLDILEKLRGVFSEAILR